MSNFETTISQMSSGVISSSVDRSITSIRKRKEKRRLGDGEDISVLLDGWTQCCFFMKQKRKLCNLARCPDSMFCGTHRPNEEGPGQRTEKQSKKKGITIDRCPCPIDPTHTIYVHNLEAHLRICNIGTREKRLAQQPFYRFNCNSGYNLEECTVVEERVCPERLAQKVQHTFLEVFNSDSANKLNVNNILNFKNGGEATHLGMREEMPIIESLVVAAVAREQSSADKLRHATQDALIVEKMISSGLLARTQLAAGEDCVDVIDEKKKSYYRDTAFVELGAGKGMLGLAVNSVCPEASIVMVERSGMRRKADKCLRENERQYHRVRMDIRHCYVPNLPGVNSAIKCGDIDGVTFSNDSTSVASSSSTSVTTTASSSGDAAAACAHDTQKKVVVIAKHLCGVATDMALRSLTPYSSSQKVPPGALHSTTAATSSPTTSGQDPEHIVPTLSHPVAAPVLDEKAAGVCIATCCHHACNWDDYVGQVWLASQGFTRAEFGLLRLWSGWAHTLRACENKRKKDERLRLERELSVGVAEVEAVLPGENEDKALPLQSLQGTAEGLVESNSGGCDGSDEPVRRRARTEDVGSDPALVHQESEPNMVQEPVPGMIQLKSISEQELVHGDEKGAHDTEEAHSSQQASSAIKGAPRPAGITYAEMGAIGGMVKRLLDHGRVMYLRDTFGFTARQVQYCDPALSPECMLIIATRPT